MDISNTTKDRLKVFLKYKKLTNQEFSEVTGLSISFINAPKESDSIGSSAFKKIYMAFPDLNLYWLLGFQGHEMLNENNPKDLSRLKEENEYYKNELIKKEGQIEMLMTLLNNKQEK